MRQMVLSLLVNNEARSTEKDPYLRPIGADRSHEAIQGCR